MAESEIENLHLPVMVREVIEILAPRAGSVFIDATLGIGGHAEALLEAANDISLIGIDQDRSAAAYLTASEAAEILGISLPTLYSYVSRGLIESQVADPGRRTHPARLRSREHARGFAD